MLRWPTVPTSRLRALLVGALLTLPLAGARAQLFAPSRFTHADSTVISSIRDQVKRGEATEADARARGWVHELERRYGRESLEVAAALALVIETTWATGQQTEDEAMRVAERQRAIRAKLLGASHADYAASIYTIGNLYLARGEYATADSLLTQSLALREQALGVDAPLVGGTHARMAYIKRLQGKFDEAETHAKRAIEIAEKNSGPNSTDVAVALTSLGNTYMMMGRFADARVQAERGHAIWTANFPPDSREVVNSLHNLSWIAYNLGEYQRAREYAEPALHARESTLKNDKPSLIDLLSNTAAIDWALGDLDLAASRYERMLGLSREVLGPDHPNFFQAENNVASFYKARGQYEKALPLLLDVEQRGRAILGEDHLEYAQNLGALGELYLDTGDLAHAEESIEEALRLERAHLGEDHPYVADLLDLLAETRKTMGRVDEARAMFEQALAIKERASSSDSPELCQILEDLASAQALGGDRAAARRTLERSLAIQEKSVGAETPPLASTLTLLARLDRAEGASSSAESRLLRALAIREKVFGAEGPLVGASLQELAELHFATGAIPAAFEEALRAERLGREHLRAMADVFSEEELLRYAALRPSGKDLLLSLLAEHGKSLPKGAARKTWDELLLSRACVLDAVAEQRHGLTVSGDTTLAALSATLRRATARHAHLLVSGDPTQAGFAAELERARTERVAAEQSMAAASASYRLRLAGTQADLASVAAHLPAKAALVAYWSYQRVPSKREDSPTGAYVALVLAAEAKEPILVPLGRADAIDEAVRAWRDTQDDASGVALRKLVWDPIADRLGRCDQLFLVPDGSLQLVSWLALPTGKEHYLAEEPLLVHTLVTERDLALPAPTSGGALLALGGIDFDADSPREERPDWVNAIARLFRGSEPDCAEFRSTRFAPLPGSRLEVDAIASLWQSARTEEAIRVSGTDATESNFKLSASGKQVLHLATHGFILGRGCVATAAGTRGIGSLGALPNAGTPRDDLAAPRPTRDPADLRTAGLALAGANLRGSADPERDDGILTAEEIAALDLSGTDWAVLSACDSGLGEVTAGEGVLGLRRAFQVAGAHSVIMSLWPVEDDDAREWMVALYRARFGERLTTSEAVRAACRERLRALRAAGREPRPATWAGFIAAGDWR